MKRTIKYCELLDKLGRFRFVTQFSNHHFTVSFNNGVLFQSYGTVVGARIDGEYYFTDAHTYSRITSKNVCEWSGLTAQQRRDGLESGECIGVEK